MGILKIWQGYRTQICAVLIALNHVGFALGYIPEGIKLSADAILIPMGGAFFAAKFTRLTKLLSGEKQP